MFIDTDFAGRWHKDYSELRDSVFCPELVMSLHFVAVLSPGVVSFKVESPY
jgi:hypothetical protein